MRHGRRVGWCVVLLVAAVVGGRPSVASAQANDGRKVWVTRSDGREEKGTLVSFSPTQILLRQAKGQIATIPFPEIRFVEVKDGVGDGARNGALIGAGLFGVLTGIALASCDYCDGSGPFVVAAFIYGAAIGGGFGAGLDAAVTHRQVIFSATSAESHVSVRPMLSPRSAGVRVSLRWARKP